MKKKLLLIAVSIGFLAAPYIALATPVSWDFSGGNLLQPLQSGWAAQIKGSYFTATSTTNPTSLQQLLVNASTTLQNFTGRNATTTNATSTTSFATTASSTNLFSTTGRFSSLTVNGQTTLGLLSGILKGTSGVVSAAANGTDYTLITAKTCNSGDFVSDVTAAGVFTCTTPASSGGLTSYDAWTHPAYGGSATTSLLTLTTGGLLVNAASSTINGNLLINGNSTTTNATSTTSFATTASSTNLFSTTGRFSNLRIDAVGTGLVLNTAGGNVSTYAGSAPCTNQVALSISASGVITCTSVTNAMLSNSTISGIALGGTLNALTATNATLTFSGSYDGTTARTVGINLANPNTWTALQTITNASTTALTVASYFEVKAASTTLQNFTAVNATTSNATSTTSFATTASSTNLFTQSFSGAGLSSCTGTNALTWTGGTFSCTAQPQGTLTAVTGTWPVISSGGTTPNITWGGAATSSNIVSAQALYATGVNTFTSSANHTLTAILDTITNASTTALTVGSFFTAPNQSSSPANTIAGSVVINTNGTASSSVAIGDGSLTHNIFALQSKGGIFASSTLAYMGAFGASGTTTIGLPLDIHKQTIRSIRCYTDQGSAWVGFGTGSATTTELQCSTTPSSVSISTNNTINGTQIGYIEIGHNASAPNKITVTADIEESN